VTRLGARCSPARERALFALLAVSCGADEPPRPPLGASQIDASSTGAATARTASSAPPEASAAAAAPRDDGRPLVLFLHGLGGSGDGMSRALEAGAMSRALGFRFAAPDGARDGHGRRYWNASGVCCDFDRVGLDHVSELGGLVRGGGYVVGFSNGGFMAHRLACDVPGVAGIVSVAGAGPAAADPPCNPKAPVAVIQIHGDADRIVPWSGGPVLGDASRPAAPGAVETVRSWSERNGCTGPLGPVRRADLLASIPGDETRIEAHAGCRARAELWTIEGADHLAPIERRVVEVALRSLLHQLLPSRP
jgi:polyhydroxybutyrate depolymerase